MLWIVYILLHFSGLNCAEAVNFAPADWLPHGGFGAELYKRYHKAAVLSHEELLCIVAKVLTPLMSLMLVPINRCSVPCRHPNLLYECMNIRCFFVIILFKSYKICITHIKLS